MKSVSVYKRLLVIMLVLGIIFVLIFYVLNTYKNKEKELFISSSTEQFSREIRSILTVPASSLNQLTYDYTYWDEFADNMTNYDSNWFNENISSILVSYEYDYVCVYDSAFNLIHEKFSDRIGSPLVIPDGELAGIKTSRFSNFYMSTPEGIYEISGASIHRTNDPSHKFTMPYGYLYIARFWDEKYIAGLASMTGASVSLRNISDTIKNVDRFTISVAQELKDWNDIAMRKVVFSRKYPVLKLYNEISRNALLIILFFVLTALLILIFAFRHWIKLPLKLVSDILESEDPGSIAKLIEAPGEFSKIGKLFENYVRQKTELKIAKEYAIKSDHLKSEFLCNMSHEIRTPMNGIIGFSHIINERNLSEEERKRYTNIIMNNSEQLLRIIDDILEISSLETKQVKVQKAKTNICTLLNELVTLFNLKAKEKNIGIQLINELEESNCMVMMDHSKLLKILGNLLENALKFTDKGFIEIGCKLQNSTLLFHVRDTGIGIEKKKIANIFTRFSQADESIKYNYGGLGLGLAIASENVALLGGEIHVESTPGVGSTFYFSVPYEPLPLVQISSYKPIDQLYLKTSDKTILVAEDENSNFVFLNALIQKMNPDINIVRACDGQEAVEKCLTDKNIDLVLMDIKMPVKNGYEATRIIKEFRPELPIIAQTAYSTSDAKSKAISAGCDDYLSKPIHVASLRAILTKFLISKEVSRPA
jgi:signal transduction histidine kinase/CheY-like chemotaxis protein